MPHESQNQTSELAFTGAVDELVYSKEYWHKRYKLVVKRFDSFNQMANEMAEADPEYYAKAEGYSLLLDVRSKRTKAANMARAVQLMEKLRPADTEKKAKSVTDRLKRQGLVAPKSG